MRRQRHTLGRIRAFVSAYGRGDYATALQIAEDFRTVGSPREHLGLLGSALLQLDRLDEAERAVKEAIASTPRSHGASRQEIESWALDMELLGEIHLEQGRYDQALTCLEASVAAWPEHGSTHRTIAELCLRRGDSPDVAVQWARLAVEKDKFVDPVTLGHQDFDLDAPVGLDLGADLATLAWAVAAAGKRRAEVNLLITEALSLVDDESVPHSAQIYLYAGQAYGSLGDPSLGDEYLTKAAELDPQGRCGRAARALMISNDRLLVRGLH